MRIPVAVIDHPNATVAFVMTGPAAAVVWVIGEWWPKMPNAVAAALAGAAITAALLTGRWIRRAAEAVNREGLIPLLRRLLSGPDAPPPAPPTPGP